MCMRQNQQTASFWRRFFSSELCFDLLFAYVNTNIFMVTKIQYNKTYDI